ncbi:N-acetylneuraminate synthase family protein [bacterium]|nr:N-acetylneuraminate synthase family protein [bacterium]
MNTRVQVIAEIGVNHNGSLDKALRLVDVAVGCGADIVKFQTFSATRLASTGTPKVPYQERDTSTSSHLLMLSRLELSYEDQTRMFDYCSAANIEFMSTPYGVPEAKFLLDLGVERFKTASADIVDVPLHQFLAATRKPVLVSTGMASALEVSNVVSIYETNDSNLTLMHTTSEYPTPASATNILRLERLKEFGHPVGYSDHTEGFVAAVMAIASGVSVIERHITLDRADVGPDHFASDQPEEFSAYVSAVREAETRMGSHEFTRTPAEEAMAKTSRKSLHMAVSRPSGWRLESDDLTLRRPGTGLGWSEVDQVKGRKLKRALLEGSIVTEDDLT